MQKKLFILSLLSFVVALRHHHFSLTHTLTRALTRTHMCSCSCSNSMAHALCKYSKYLNGNGCRLSVSSGCASDWQEWNENEYSTYAIVQ